MPDLPSCTADPRPPVEVLDRALALACVVTAAAGGDGQRLAEGYDVAHALTDDEAAYLADAADGVRVEAAARALHVEQVAVLAWALDLAPEPPLDEPSRAASVVVGDVMAPPTTTSSPGLRPVGELRAAHDLYSAMAWALRDDPELAVGAAPGAVDPYVVRERLAALEWLFGLNR